MSTNPKVQSYKKIAVEAAFQVECDSEFAGWMFALMTAIHDDHKHSGGQNSSGLSSLGVFLAESHHSDSERAVELFNARINDLGGVK